MAASCAPTQTRTTGRSASTPPPSRTARSQSRQEEIAARIAEVDPLNPRHYERAGRTRTAGVTAIVQDLGTIPYDNMTLPLVSPDGRYVATHRGVAPDWPTILAEPDAAVPTTTRIEIYRLGESEDEAPQLKTIVDEAALLGRACTREGFLVEAPRENGSRWIGIAAWETGLVRWLVSDDSAVNAFATLREDGALAFSSRPIDGEQFDLIVRTRGAEWRLPGQGGSWLMPTWSGSGDGLFALLLRGEALDVVHMIASDAAQVRRTIRPLPLAASGANLDTAYQTLNTAVVTPARGGAAGDQLTFFHPSRFRAAVWAPPDVPVLLDRDSLAAVIDSDDPRYALVTRSGRLIRRRIADEEGLDRIDIIEGTHVPRVTAAEERPYLLLRPSEGVIGVLGLRLLPTEMIRER